MGKIRDKTKKKDKIEIPQVKPLTHIVFSLRYLTESKNFGLEYFGKDLRKSHEAYVAFVSRMRELCQVDIVTAQMSGNIFGSEHIPYKMLSKSMQSVCDSVEIISKDSDLTVFRFYQNNYRLLCKADLNHGNLLHIVAFDFDYSAYNHGS